MELEALVTISLDLPPELESGLVAEAQAQGVSIEAIVTAAVHRYVAESAPSEIPEPEIRDEQGIMVIYGGKPLPANVVDDVIQAIREERERSILGPYF